MCRLGSTGVGTVQLGRHTLHAHFRAMMHDGRQTVVQQGHILHTPQTHARVHRQVDVHVLTGTTFPLLLA